MNEPQRLNIVTLTPYRLLCLKEAAQMISSLAALTAPRVGDEEHLLTSQLLALADAERALVGFVWGVLDEAEYDANVADDRKVG